LLRYARNDNTQDVIASLSPAIGRPTLDETGGKACGGAMAAL